MSVPSDLVLDGNKIVTANIRGIRKLIADGVPGQKHDALVALYNDVREPWFELVKRARIGKAQREAKRDGRGVRKPVGRALSSELLTKFDALAKKHKVAGFSDGRALVDFLKEFPPARNAADHNAGIQRQIERRDTGFEFEASLAKNLRASGQYLWVGRSAGSYGAVDIVAISKRGVLLAQCKATNAERTNTAEHKKLSVLHAKLGRIAEIRLYFLREGQPVYVKIDDRSLPKLAGEPVVWKVVQASVKLARRTPAEHNAMIAELATKLHWRGNKRQLDTLYNALTPFFIELAKSRFQWDAEKRIKFRQLLDPYRGFLASQDAHVTKALLLPKFSPVEVAPDEIKLSRDAVLETRIVKQAGFAMRVEHEPSVKTPIHVVRSTVAGDKIICYHCRRNGLFSEEEVEQLWKLVDALPTQVEFRVAWYLNRRTIKTKTIKTHTDLEWFTKQRGI
jgi:hypothetical protein